MRYVGVLAVVILAASGLSWAQEGQLHGVVDVTYQSKYIWRGIDIFNDESGIQPGIDLDLYGSGFGVSAMGHRANTGEFENGERWDYTLYYQNHLFGEEKHAVNYRVGWVYYNFPDQDEANFDVQEFQAALSFPNLLPVEGLIPTYVAVKLFPSSADSSVGSKSATPAGVRTRGTASGCAHILMLDYGLSVSGMLPGKPNQVLKLHGEVVFNDGVHPGGGNVDHDWSNAVFGVSIDFDMGNDMTLTPGLYHQITMDDSINADKDETWVTLGMRYKF